MEEDLKLITELTRIIQRIEKEGYNIAESDIRTVWQAKTKLGYTHPISIEEGTGSILPQYKPNKFEQTFNKLGNNFDYTPPYFNTNDNNICDKCPNNIKNGGAGICNCLYGSPKIMC